MTDLGDTIRAGLDRIISEIKCDRDKLIFSEERLR